MEDSTRGGYRKILVFFLVDPAVRVLSTAQVPPQQMSWFKEEVFKQSIQYPVALVDTIVDLLDWPMTLTEAKKHREALMDERKNFISKSNDECFERPFYMCEH